MFFPTWEEGDKRKILTLSSSLPVPSKVLIVVFTCLPSSFAGEDGQKVLLVTLPDFSSTKTACLINLCDLACQPVTFSAFGDEEEETVMETGD